jgi:hypothetical protein
MQCPCLSNAAVAVVPTQMLCGRSSCSIRLKHQRPLQHTVAQGICCMNPNQAAECAPAKCAQSLQMLHVRPVAATSIQYAQQQASTKECTTARADRLHPCCPTLLMIPRQDQHNSRNWTYVSPQSIRTKVHHCKATALGLPYNWGALQQNHMAKVAHCQQCCRCSSRTQGVLGGRGAGLKYPQIQLFNAPKKRRHKNTMSAGTHLKNSFAHTYACEQTTERPTHTALRQQGSDKCAAGWPCTC